MTASEINVVVAAKVMGWRPSRDEDGPRYWSIDVAPPFEHSTGWWCEEPPLVQDEIGDTIISPLWQMVGQKVWNPAKDVADAFEVVTRLIADKWDWVINSFAPESDAPIWEVELKRYRKDEPINIAPCSELPRAICLAALVSVGAMTHDAADVLAGNA